MTDWKTWPKCFFFNRCFFFFFFWAADMSDLSRSQLWNMELDVWMNKIQDRTQSWKSLLLKVFHFVSHIFSYILTSKFIKSGKNYASKKKRFKPWILLNEMRSDKQMRAAALRHRIYFFQPNVKCRPYKWYSRVNLVGQILTLLKFWEKKGKLHLKHVM